MSYKKCKLKQSYLNQIWLREPLEILTIQPTKYLKWTTEFEYNGHELLIHINYSQSSHLDILKDNSTYSYSYTYNMHFSHTYYYTLITYLLLYTYHTLIAYNITLIHQWKRLICITIDNGSNNTVGGSCYSAHQAVRRFAEHHIDMVSCVHRKCQTRAGVWEKVISRLNVSL